MKFTFTFSSMTFEKLQQYEKVQSIAKETIEFLESFIQDLNLT